MDNKAQFISAAIHDCQATIRATDVKVGALLAALFLPFTHIVSLWDSLERIATFFDSHVFTVLFFVVWFVAIYTLITTISAIDNPAKHIDNDADCQGSFYGSDLYRFRLFDAFHLKPNGRATQTVSTFSSTFPVTDEDICNELTFEHMKLIYIRDIKLHRLNLSLRLSTAWFVISAIAFLTVRISCA
ncbi:hypothetical protein IC617_08670 [Neiella sp. HB171785]|uniref:Uncharacterized protein n=1 Tax=Neiella litorisoli TaxID=2771431 RepID=A0A8J6QGG7_9GAMM|nr:hypothetical protein [Neiella litorisoli]MBD1389499.1 hypothetical protein [Neiella litorisoli]